MEPHFWKYQALGNDYLVLRQTSFPFPPSKEFIQAVCHRQKGVGSDGALWLEFPAEKPPQVRIFNPDGKEAERSGNGLRILSRHLWEHGFAKKGVVSFVTQLGAMQAKVLDQEGFVYAMELGKPSFDAKKFPLPGIKGEALGKKLSIEERVWTIHPVHVGNPHCVLRMEEEPTEAFVREWGQKIEQHPLFPQGVNVQFAKVKDKHTLAIKIWERGAGYTLSSGSSSTAAAAVALRMKWCCAPVEVQTPGGNLRLTLEKEKLTLEGSAHPVCSGNLAPGFLEKFSPRKK